MSCYVFFFFQAEDGIRDYKVTGVQTCALPICARGRHGRTVGRASRGAGRRGHVEGSDRLGQLEDRKSTRLNSSHLVISYAVFCLKKKKITHHALPARYTKPPMLHSALIDT